MIARALEGLNAAKDTGPGNAAPDTARSEVSFGFGPHLARNLAHTLAHKQKIRADKALI